MAEMTKHVKPGESVKTSGGLNLKTALKTALKGLQHSTCRLQRSPQTCMYSAVCWLIRGLPVMELSVRYSISGQEQLNMFKV